MEDMVRILIGSKWQDDEKFTRYRPGLADQSCLRCHTFELFASPALLLLVVAFDLGKFKVPHLACPG